MNEQIGHITVDTLTPEQEEVLRSFVDERRASFFLSEALIVLHGESRFSDENDGKTAKELSFYDPYRKIGTQIIHAQRTRSCNPEIEDPLNTPVKTKPEIRASFGTDKLPIDCYYCPFGPDGVVTRQIAKTRCSEALKTSELILRNHELQNSANYPITVTPQDSAQKEYWYGAQVKTAIDLFKAPMGQVFDYDIFHSDEAQANLRIALAKAFGTIGIAVSSIDALQIKLEDTGHYYSHMSLTINRNNGLRPTRLILTLPVSSKDTIGGKMLIQDYQMLKIAATNFQGLSRPVKTLKIFNPDYLGSFHNDNAEFPFYLGAEIDARKIGIQAEGKELVFFALPKRNEVNARYLGKDFAKFLQDLALIRQIAGFSASRPSINAGDFMIDFNPQISNQSSHLIYMTFRGGYENISDEEWCRKMLNHEELVRNRRGQYITVFPFRDYSTMSPEEALRSVRVLRR
ncbi:hypothetical protein KBD45_02315 [Candidatus Dojkabacteria bacterium]|nr:hypothetical protein [Candidatus Dojkabacteria bacterium]